MGPHIVDPTSSDPYTPDRIRIGMLWGDFPWAQPPIKLGKLLSMGSVARNLTYCLNNLGTVIPYTPPLEASPDHKHAHLAAFLQSIDLLWADVYAATEPALRLRQQLQLDCPVLLFAGGAMTKGAEAMLFPWQQLLTPDDHLIFSCEADRQIWQLLGGSSALHEWVIPLGVDDTVFVPRPPPERAAVRAAHKLLPDAPLLLYVGRLNIQKNLHLLLRLLAAVIGIETKPALHIRTMQKRWDSCTINGTILLNLKLIQARKALIEYVIVHDLCHLKEHNHSRTYYQLVDCIMSDWQERRDELNLTKVP